MKKIILLILLTISTNVFANEWVYVSGNDLIKHLKDNDRDGQFYISGVVDAISVLEPYGKEICIEAGTSLMQLGQLTYNHMQKHPEKWMDPGSYFVITMLRETYPCKK